MKANPMMWKFAGFALVTLAGTGAFLACSSDDNSNNNNPVIGDDGGGSSSGSGSGGTTSGSGSGGTSSGSSSGSSSGGGDSGPDAAPACVPDGGSSAQCNSCAFVASDPTKSVDPYNTCGPYACQGFYDNTAHGVPTTLPTP
jgi:hypothetical protein